MPKTKNNSTIDSTLWNSLFRQIEKEQCVPLIGTDLVSYPNDKSFFQLLCEKIGESDKLNDYVEKSLKYGFEYDKLLQFRPFAHSDSVYDFLKEFYDS